MAINDDNIGWNRRRKFIKCRTMLGVLDDGTSGIPASLGNGTTGFQEAGLSGGEIAGLDVNADADEVYDFLPTPWDMDITAPMRFRVHFIHASTDADVFSAQVAYKGQAKGVAFQDAKSSPDETVNIPNHTCSTTDDSFEVTAWGESNSHNYLATTDFGINLALTIDSMGAGSGEITILGIEIDYVVGAAPNQFRQPTEFQPTSGSTPND